MPLPVRFRAPAADSARKPWNGGARSVVRALVRAAAGIALCGVLSAQAQQQGGQIYIAGPGDRAGSDAATMTAMAQTPANARAGAAGLPASAVVGGPARTASAPGMISIPGPGERNAAQAGKSASAPKVVTIPGPGERAAPAALPRVSVAASRVTPVIVGAQPAGASGTAAASRSRPATAAAAQPVAAPQPIPPGQQDGESVRAAALAYLKQQSAGLPGRVSITVAPVFPRGLAACTSLEPFMPPGARTWGRTTVGMRCIGDRPWTLYVQARVVVQVTYYTAARQIGAGETLAAIDLEPRDGDLASLPRTVITDPSQALGAVSLARIAAGLPLRTDMLRSMSSVVIGQTVRLVAAGPNFTISTEGSALNNAAPGQQVQVRTGGGQIVTGVVKDAGTVEVQI